MQVNPVGWAIAAFFLVAGAAIAIAAPEARALGLIWAGVGVFLFLLYFWIGRRARRADKLRRSGVPGRAVIKSMVQTGTYVNQQPVVKLDLEVQPEGLPAYELEKRAVVPMMALGQLGVGNALPVHVDPSDRDKIAIDWGAPAESAVAGSGSRTGRDPSQRLSELKRMREDGTITEQEFEAKKAQILAEL